MNQNFTVFLLKDLQTIIPVPLHKKLYLLFVIDKRSDYTSKMITAKSVERKIGTTSRRAISDI